MSNNQDVIVCRRTKQYWRDFGNVVHVARKYAKAGLTADDVVQELNELVAYYDLEQVVRSGVPEQDMPGQATISFEGKAAQG